ncbi:hypothetical protein [Sulfobacillus sp. hq2]|uniref:hypothetical protein n=1 Tax=Sulfobacillus TaxID=28033 RepID=UPI000CD1FBFC|nr:hypothetical protein [Sulfobacillus sp. hq2]POB11439.1 hypothetical protein CO251_04660 [Sulfobacillus sp. hq2]
MTKTLAKCRVCEWKARGGFVEAYLKGWSHEVLTELLDGSLHYVELENVESEDMNGEEKN